MILNFEMSNGHMRETSTVSLTALKVETILKSMTYDGCRREKDPVVENACLPSFAKTFYALVYAKNSIPSSSEFVNLYLSSPEFRPLNSEFVNLKYENGDLDLRKSGVIARALRAYPSLVRDLHFYLMAWNSGLFEFVNYSTTSDYKDGVDVKVMLNKTWYKIALYQGSSRSLQFKSRKNDRHGKQNDDIIDVVLDKDNCKHCGPYDLFSQADVQYVYDTIIQRQESKK